MICKTQTIHLDIINHINKLNSFDINRIHTEIIYFLTNITEDLLNDFTIIIVLYFYNLFQNSLYQNCEFLNNLFQNVCIIINGNNLEQTYIIILNLIKNQPYLSAEGLTINNIEIYINSLKVENNEIIETKCYLELIDYQNFYENLLNYQPKKLFYRKLADEGLTVTIWREFIQFICNESLIISKLNANATIVIFIDELNTANALGLITEAFLTHSIDGKPLPLNLFFVGAINPFRQATLMEKKTTIDFSKIGFNNNNNNNNNNNDNNNNNHNVHNNYCEDESVDYLACAPYIVKPLSSSMSLLTMDFPNLTLNGEKQFLLDYFHNTVHISCPIGYPDEIWMYYWLDFCNKAVNMIINAQNLVRSYNIPRVYMSIRNLIRATHLFQSLADETFNIPTNRIRGNDILNSGTDYARIFLPLFHKNQSNNSNEIDFDKKIDELNYALIMTIAVTYLFQLPSAGHVHLNNSLTDLRSKFINDMNDFNQNKMNNIPNNDFKVIITSSLEHLFSYATIPKGLAKTNALMENFYTIILCAMNRIPLLITGPPGMH